MHKADLVFALESLSAINQVSEEPRTIRQALWRSAVLHYMKCFGDNHARFPLSPEKVFKGQPAVCMEVFEYFKSLRNKHLAHDENNIAQGLPGAIINGPEEATRIARVICLSMFAETLNEEGWSNLHLSIQQTLEWVSGQFDRVSELIAADLEKKPHHELMAMEDLRYVLPKVEEIHDPRS